MVGLGRFFGAEGMVPQSMRRGELPGTREAYRTMTRIALPSVLEMALMSTISMADTAMVSTVGTDAIAAVGLVTQPRMLLLCIFVALNTGVTAIVARRRGEGRRADANLTLRNAIVVALILIAAIMLLGYPLSERFMRLAGGEEGRTLEDATAYFRILMLSVPVNALSMCICAAQRGVGNTKLTFYVNLASNLVNVVFNALLINGIGPFPRLGVRGAAIATVIGLCVGFVLSVLSLFHRDRAGAFLSLSFRDSWRLDGETLRSVSKVGKSALLEQICIRLGFFAYARIVAGLGTDPYAAHNIAMQFLSISFSFGDGIGIAGTSLVGQSLGRGRPDHAHLYGKIAQRFALIAALCLAAIVISLRGPLVGLFIYEDTANAAYVRALATRLMIIVGIMQPFQTSAVVNSGALRGAGDTFYVAVAMTLTVVVMRPLLSLAAIYVVGTRMGYGEMALVGAWCMALIDMITRMALMLRRYNGGKWHAIRL
ncbi:MAG: MATE family efflux transporter [Clostridiales bacterium]|nr:MATE family efflux transporter [Clostridiales bacterium]